MVLQVGCRHFLYNGQGNFERALCGYHEGILDRTEKAAELNEPLHNVPGYRTLGELVLRASLVDSVLHPPLLDVL